MKKLLVAVLAGAIGLAATSAHAQTRGFGTMNPGTLSNNIGSAIAKLMVEKLGIQARIQPHRGTTDYVPLINSGELDFGISNVIEISNAFNGKGPWKGNAQKNLRIAAALAPLRVVMFARADDDSIKTLADLKGKRITTGFKSIQTVSTQVFPSILASAGLTLDDVVPVPVDVLGAGADAFLDGRADAFFFAVGAGKVAQVHASIPLKALPYADDPAAVARMKAVFPLGFITVAKPAPPFPYLTQPTKVMTFDNLLITGSHVPDDVLESVAEGLATGKADLVAAFRGLAGFSPKRMVKKSLPTPYHDGVLSWAAKQ